MNNNFKSDSTEILELAASYLESKGYTILERNYFFEDASVDLVVYEGNLILFISVRTDSRISNFSEDTPTLSTPEQQQVFKASEAWMYERKMDNAPARYDLVVVNHKPENSPDITYIRNAFHPD